MTAAVTDWIRAVLLVSFLSTLVRLLLPDNSLRPFIRLVTGLVLLSVLLQPLLLLIGAGNTWDQAAFGNIFGSATSSAQMALVSGETLRERGRLAALEQVQNHVRSQIEAILSLLSEVDGVRVDDIELDEHGVKGLILHLSGRRETGDERVRDLLFKYFGIDPTVVTTRWREEGP